MLFKHYLKKSIKERGAIYSFEQSRLGYKEICWEYDIVSENCFFNNIVTIYYKNGNESHLFSKVCEECCKEIRFLSVEC